MKAKLFLLLLLSIPVVGLSAFDLKDEIGDKAFKESGLEKLTKEELATLNEAVAKLLGVQEAVIRAEAELPQGEDRFGLETVKKRVETLFQKDSPDIIESRIVGDFSGWSGKTRFVLENGQVWQQTKPESFIIKKLSNPKVMIRRGTFGGYLLKIDGYNSSCRVERVK